MSIEELMGYRGNLCILGSAALGAFIAGLADSLVKQDASATKSIATFLWSDFHVGSEPERAYAFVLLVILAALLSLVFDVPSKRAAFGVGVGILSSVLTITPYQEKPALSLVSSSGRIGGISARGTNVVERLLGIGEARAQDIAGAAEVHLVVSWETGLAHECTITIYDIGRRGVIGRSRYADRSDFRIQLQDGQYLMILDSPQAATARYSFALQAAQQVTLQAVLGRDSSIRETS